MNASKVCQKSIACYQNALKMNEQKQNVANQELPFRQEVGSAITEAYDLIRRHPELVHSLLNSDVVPLSEKDRLRKAVDEMRIGQRIHDELKRQGRTVTWLAQQLNMERTSLYYTFRQSSIDLELLLRISAFLEHNFLQDVAEAYISCGLPTIS